MQFGRSCGLRMASGAFLLIHLGILNCMAYLDREPRLRQQSIWKRLLPWFNPPTAKLEPKHPFFVVWNSPTFRCGRRYGLPMDLKKFGIVGNDLELFHGDVINLFYESRFGLYPRILKNGISFNGGIPQLANFTAHFEWVKADLDWYIPNKTYDGLAVIDWEAWRPLFEQNNGDKRRYALRALAVVKSRHPWWRGTHVYWKTQQEFDKAARRLMEETNSLCQRLRPNAKWGFYMFPTCYNGIPGQNYCKKSTIEQNDKMSWLYQKSKALYPSLYLKTQQHPELQRLYVEGALRETYRVSRRHCQRDALVIPYARYSYPTNREFYSKSDLESSIGQAADSGAAGIVLWETYKNIQHKTDCKNTHNYLHTVLGPFVKNVLKFTQKCSEHLCNGHGRCISKQWSNYGLVSSKPHTDGSQHRRGKRSIHKVTKFTDMESYSLPSRLAVDEYLRNSSEDKGVGQFSGVLAVRKRYNENALDNSMNESLWRNNLDVSKEDMSTTVKHLSVLNGWSPLHENSQEKYLGEHVKFDTDRIFGPSIDEKELQPSATGSSTSQHLQLSLEVKPSTTTHMSYSMEKSVDVSNMEYLDNPILRTQILDKFFETDAKLTALENNDTEAISSILLSSRESLTRKDPLITGSQIHIETKYYVNTNAHTDTLPYTSITPNSVEMSADLEASYPDVSGSFLKSTFNKGLYAPKAPTIPLSTSDMYSIPIFSNSASLAVSNAGDDSTKEVKISPFESRPLYFYSNELTSTTISPTHTFMLSSASINISPNTELTSKHGSGETTPLEDIELARATDSKVSRKIIKIEPSIPTFAPILVRKRAVRKRVRRRRRRRRRRKGKFFRKRRPMENETVERKHRKIKKINIRQQFSNYVCRCYDGWTGEFCQHKLYHWQ